MKRPFTLASAIVAVSILAFEILYNLTTLYSVMILAEYESVEPKFLVIALLCLSVLLVTQILNILLITLWKSSPEKFAKGKKTYITTLVFDIAVIAVAITRLATAGYTISAMMIIWYLMLQCTMITCFVLCCIDLCKEKTKAKSLMTAIQTEKERELIAKRAVKNFEDNISKLNALKDNGSITEEEYISARQKYIQDELK